MRLTEVKMIEVCLLTKGSHNGMNNMPCGSTLNVLGGLPSTIWTAIKWKIMFHRHGSRFNYSTIDFYPWNRMVVKGQSCTFSQAIKLPWLISKNWSTDDQLRLYTKEGKIHNKKQSLLFVMPQFYSYANFLSQSQDKSISVYLCHCLPRWIAVFALILTQITINFKETDIGIRWLDCE